MHFGVRMELPEEILEKAPSREMLAEIKNLTKGYAKLDYPEITVLSKGKFSSVMEIYNVSKSLKSKRNKEAKQLGERIEGTLNAGVNVKHSHKETGGGGQETQRTMPRAGLTEGRSKTPGEKALPSYEERIKVAKTVRQMCADFRYDELKPPRYKEENNKETAIILEIDTVAFGSITFVLERNNMIIIKCDDLSSSGECSELPKIIKRLKEKLPELPIVLMGIQSLGGTLPPNPPLEQGGRIEEPKIYAIIKARQGENIGGQMIAGCDSYEDALVVLGMANQGTMIPAKFANRTNAKYFILDYRDVLKQINDAQLRREESGEPPQYRYKER